MESFAYLYYVMIQEDESLEEGDRSVYHWQSPYYQYQTGTDAVNSFGQVDRGWEQAIYPSFYMM